MIFHQFPQSPDPPNPPAPTELRVTNMSFGPGRAVAARVQWSMTSDLDVPVHHYKVSWSWTAAGQPSASSVTKRRKIVREVRRETSSYVLSTYCIWSRGGATDGPELDFFNHIIFYVHLNGLIQFLPPACPKSGTMTSICETKLLSKGIKIG